MIHHLRILGRIDRQLVPPVYAISNICNRWHFWLQLSFNSPGSVSTQSWIYSRDSHITCQSILNHSPGAKNHQFKAIQIPIRITKLSPLTHLSLSLSLSFSLSLSHIHTHTHYNVFAGAVYSWRYADGQLRAGRYRVQAQAQRPPRQHRPQVRQYVSKREREKKGFSF